MGSYGEDWLEMQNRDHQQSGVNRVDGYSDFMLSSRISYEMDLKGPWYVTCHLYNDNYPYSKSGRID